MTEKGTKKTTQQIEARKEALDKSLGVNFERLDGKGTDKNAKATDLLAELTKIVSLGARSGKFDEVKIAVNHAKQETDETKALQKWGAVRDLTVRIRDIGAYTARWMEFIGKSLRNEVPQDEAVGVAADLLEEKISPEDKTVGISPAVEELASVVGDIRSAIENMRQGEAQFTTWYSLADNQVRAKITVEEKKAQKTTKKGGTTGATTPGATTPGATTPGGPPAGAGAGAVNGAPQGSVQNNVDPAEEEKLRELGGRWEDAIRSLKAHIGKLRPVLRDVIEDSAAGRGTLSKGSVAEDTEYIPTILDSIVRKYARDSRRLGIPEANAGLRAAMEVHGVDPRAVAVTTRDKVIFLGVTFLLRIVILAAIGALVSAGAIQTLWGAFVAFQVIYLVAVVVMFVVVNLSDTSYRVAFGFLNINGGYGVMLHAIVTTVVGYIVLDVAGRAARTPTRARFTPDYASGTSRVSRLESQVMLMTQLSVITLVTWVTVSVFTMTM